MMAPRGRSPALSLCTHVLQIDAQSQAVVDAIAGQPGKEFSHPVYGNPMRILQDDVPFTVDAFKPGAPSAADIRKAENLARCPPNAGTACSFTA